MGMFDSPAGNPLPQFPATPRTRPRIVVENADGAERFIASRLLDEAGYEVVGCGGPHDLLSGTCPLVDDRDCPAIEQADVVVTSLRLEGEEGWEVVGAVRQRYPSVPCVVEAPPLVAERHPERLDGCRVVFPLTAESLLVAVDELLGQAARS